MDSFKKYIQILWHFKSELGANVTSRAYNITPAVAATLNSNSMYIYDYRASSNQLKYPSRQRTPGWMFLWIFDRILRGG